MRKHPLESIKKRDDFKRVFSCARCAASPLFVLHAARNGTARHRVGFSVSKKVGNAVTRNRVKRQAREFCRLHFADFGGQAARKAEPAHGFDFIIVARAPSGALPREGSFAQVSDALSRLFSRLGVQGTAK